MNCQNRVIPDLRLPSLGGQLKGGNQRAYVIAAHKVYEGMRLHKDGIVEIVRIRNRNDVARHSVPLVATTGRPCPMSGRMRQ